MPDHSPSAAGPGTTPGDGPGSPVGTEPPAGVPERALNRLIGLRRNRFGGVSGAGAAFGLVGYLGANSVSLLPRPWYLQGLIAAICGLLFYLFGVGVGALARWLKRIARLQVQMDHRARTVLLWAWVLILALGVIAYPFSTLDAQRVTAEYVGQPAPGPAYLLGSVVVAVVGFSIGIGLWRLIDHLFDRVLSMISRRGMRRATARTIATVLTALMVYAIADQVVVRGFTIVSHTAADAVNADRPADLSAPTSPLRSGGPGSPETWSSLGQDGAIFVASGPDSADISAATGAAALEPIRVFAGVHDRTLEQTRDAAMAELDRTDAFSRKAILVVTSTSTGFVNEWAAESFEYLLGGDTAIVSMQYSTLPSATALLLNRDDPPLAATLLFDAVRARIDAMPVGARPKLYVSGESLGAYGGNGAFSSPEDMLAKVDGALWTGTPSFVPVRAALIQRKSPGSTVTDPVIDNGRNFRFAGNPAELTADQFGRPLGQWQFPRVAYLQHDTDPVVWWSPGLLFSTPAWLREYRTPGTPMAQMGWLPVATFWQVTADMSVSNSVTGGYGHRYWETETVPAWAAILGLDPSTDRSSILRAIARATADQR